MVRSPLSRISFRFLRIDRYPELRELELRQLARVLLSSDPGPTLGVLNAKIRSYTSGELPHAEHVLPALYELMESDESVEEMPLPAAASSNQRVTGGDWDGLKGALTSSLTSGTFLDSQFYAVESRSSTGSPEVRPVYFCGRVGGNFVSELAACESLTQIVCVEVSLTNRYRFFKTQDTESPAPSVCGWIRQRYRGRKTWLRGSHGVLPVFEMVCGLIPNSSHKLIPLAPASGKILYLRTSPPFC